MTELVLALDRGSIRKTDLDGHMHTGLTPVSKADVNPYYGYEIPGWQKLGLDADKVYRLYRAPEELRKATPTFAGKPLLSAHNPVSADDHDHARTVGAVRDPVWRAPYLMAALDIWSGAAIDGIKSGRQKELSSGYRYVPDMTPGATPDGVRYDGVMRDISANHVALVVQGRAGPDVVVGDAALAKLRVHDVVTKPVLDAAIARAMKGVTATVIKRQHDIREAEAAVHPHVGAVLACDSATEVYRTALKRLNVCDADTLCDAALKPVFEASVSSGSRPFRSAPTRALDEMFPGLQRLRARP